MKIQVILPIEEKQSWVNKQNPMKIINLDSRNEVNKGLGDGLWGEMVQWTMVKE